MTAASRLEEAILIPRDPLFDANTDEWPEFQLSDARVCSCADTDTPISLLRASEAYPLTVRGRLETLPMALSHLYREPTSSRTTLIEISQVKSFAYGQYDDGSVALWAMGRAGWYVVKPSRAYRETYNEMIDSIKTLYFVVDAYREPRVSGKGKNVTLLPPYTVGELFEKYAKEFLGGCNDASKKIHSHRDFLLSSMIAGKEGLVWSKNPLYLHLCAAFAGDLEEVRRRMSKPAMAPTLERPSKADRSETGSASSSLKQRRRRPLQAKPINTISPDSLVDLPEIRVASKQDITQSEAVPPKPIARTRRKPAQTRTRRSLASHSTVDAPNAATPIGTSDSDDGDSHPRRAQKGKSALRPKASEGNKGKADDTPALEEDGEDADEAAPRSSPVGSKRKSEDAARETHQLKRQNKRQQHVDEGIDIPESPSASSATTLEDTTAGAASEFALCTVHAPDHVQEDTWACALDGCTHKVYLASKAESQRLIREHYKLHAFDEDERVQLVKKLRAPSLPVTHLMDRVRMQARLERFPGSQVAGSRFPLPMPVMQRY